MKSIMYIGMDVHTTNYMLCCYSVEDDWYFAEIEIKPDYREVLKYIYRIQSQRGEGTEILCGYEARCLGYSLYHQLTYHGIIAIQQNSNVLTWGVEYWQRGDSNVTQRGAKTIGTGI